MPATTGWTGPCAGAWRGVTLGDDGLAEAQAVASRLAPEPLAAVYTSPMERCRQTAEAVAAPHALAPQLDHAFTEVDFGDWTGLSFEQLQADPRWEPWNSRRSLNRPPDGESLGEAQMRAWRGVEALLRLAALTELQTITSFRPLTPTGSAPQHWTLTRTGRAILAAEDGHPDTTTLHRAPRTPPAAIAHSAQLRHQLGVNTCLTTLATHTLSRHTASGAADGDVGLRAWWGQARCTRHFGDHVRPDAYALLTHHPNNYPPDGPQPCGSQSGGQPHEADRSPDRLSRTHPHPRPSSAACQLGFFLEYDTGSETLHRLADKLPRYHHLATATAITTAVLFWLPTSAREHHTRTVLIRALAALPHPQRLPIATTSPRPHHSTHPNTTHPNITHTAPHTAGHLPPLCALAPSWDPHAPAWSPLTAPPQQHHHTEPTHLLSLLELAHLWAPAQQAATHLHANPPPDSWRSPGPARRSSAASTAPLTAPLPTPPPLDVTHPARRGRGGPHQLTHD